jgi:hypothetical protein
VSRRAWLGLLALVLFVCRDAVFRGRVFYERDIELAWQPQISVFVRCIGQGAWPIWDPLVAFGQPLLADPSLQLLYPPTWLNLLVMPWTYYTVFVVSHLLFGAIGVHALARIRGIAGGGAFVAAVLWTLSGPTLSLVNLYHHFAGATWIPWVLFTAERAFRSRRWPDAVWLGFAFGAQLLAGSAEMAMASVLAAAIGAGFSYLDWRAPWAPANRRLVASAVLAGALGVGLAAGQWFPTAELASRSQRRRLEDHARGAWSVHPFAALEALVPVSLGRLPLRYDWRQRLFDGREPFLASLYLGAPVLAFVLAADRRQALVPAVWAGGAFLLALGRHTPVHAVATAVVPVLGSFRYPVKAMAVVSLGWALLAGSGFEVWRSGWLSGRRRRAFWVVLGGVALLSGAASALVWFAPAGVGASIFHQPDPFGRSLDEVLHVPRWDLLTVWVSCLAVMALAAAARERPRLPAATLVAVLATANLAWIHRGANPTVPRDMLSFRPRVLGALPTSDTGRLYVYDYAGFEGKAEEHLGRLSPYTVLRVPPGWTRSQAQALALRLYPVPPQPEIWGAAGAFDLDARGLFSTPSAELAGFLRVTEGTPEHLRLLRLGAVAYMIALHERGLEDLEPVATFESLFAEPIRLFRVPRPLPRAYAVSGSRSAEGRFALERVLVDPGFVPEREVVLAGPPQPARADFVSEVHIREERSDWIRMDATLSHEGWVVLVDTYDPGWQATVDGAVVPLERANHAFRAVRVPAGRHEIEQVYRPRALVAGVGVSALALTMGIGLVIAASRRRE